MLTSVLEPSFYWRVDRDYGQPPDPKIIYFDPRLHTIEDIRRLVEAADRKYPRVVLQVATLPKYLTDHATKNLLESIGQKKPLPENGVLSNSKIYELESMMKDVRESIENWARDSVGKFSGYYFEEILKYYPLPSVKGLRGIPNSDYNSRLKIVLRIEIL
jgi:hypothetical protein